MQTRDIKIHDRQGVRMIGFDDPRDLPIQEFSMLGIFARFLDGAQSIHTADPVSRGIGLFIKATAITFAMAIFTVAALWALDSLHFMVWLLWASGEWVACFLFLAYNDWREHPNSIRWKQSEGLLQMMWREQDARLLLKGIDPQTMLPRHEIRLLPKRDSLLNAYTVFVGVVLFAFACLVLMGELGL